jgi:basic membrane lipoprotein Med (substrate-binding protein (PBP1-ABC) superfamily)
MIEAGADVLSGNLNNGWTGVYEAAGSGDGVQVITEWVDNHEVAPDVIVSSVLKSQATFVVDIVRTVQDGSFAGEFVSQPLPDDWGPVLADTELLPDDVYDQALEIQAQIASGEIEVEHDETCPS